MTNRRMAESASGEPIVPNIVASCDWLVAVRSLNTRFFFETSSWASFSVSMALIASWRSSGKGPTHFSSFWQLNRLSKWVAATTFDPVNSWLHILQRYTLLPAAVFFKMKQNFSIGPVGWTTFGSASFGVGFDRGPEGVRITLAFMVNCEFEFVCKFTVLKLIEFCFVSLSVELSARDWRLLADLMTVALQPRGVDFNFEFSTVEWRLFDFLINYTGWVPSSKNSQNGLPR